MNPDAILGIIIGILIGLTASPMIWWAVIRRLE